jgi:hypothetical protein
MIYLKQTGEKFSDIYAAREAVLRLARGGEEKKRKRAELVLDPGEYVLSRPLVFSEKENTGLWRTAVSFSCENGRAVFTSEKELPISEFEKTGDHYTYRFPKDEKGEYPRLGDLWADGARVPKCRSREFTHAFAFSEDNKRDNRENLAGIFVPEEAAMMLTDAEACAAEITLHVEWEFFILHVIGVDTSHTRYDEHGGKHVLLRIKPDELYAYVTKMNPYLNPKDREFYLGNCPSLLSEGSFCYDAETGVLCYRPRGEMPKKLAVATLEKLFVFEEMDGIYFKNIDFTGVTDKYTCKKGFLSHQACVEKRLENKAEEAAIFARDVRRVSIDRCGFYELGAGGVLMLGELAMIYVRNSRFENIAMSALSIGNPTRASREKRNCSFDVRVENNYLKNIGFGFPTAPAINIFRVDGVSICRNTIDHCAYSGVSVGWEWGMLRYALGEMINIRDAEISHNRILHHMEVLRDGGAIYVVGSNCTVENTRFFNFMHDNFAYRDNVKRTVRGYYLDGSSSNWHVYDNVVSGAQRPAFAQFIVESEYTHNNLVENTYTTEPMDEENHCPERNTIFKGTKTEESLDALFREYPRAKEIYENSGCSADVANMKPEE